MEGPVKPMYALLFDWENQKLKLKNWTWFRWQSEITAK